jgi:hypothetical protein
MRRREFIKLLGGATAWPLSVRAQQREGVCRIGVLIHFSESQLTGQRYIEAFRQGLKELGWTDGGMPMAAILVSRPDMACSLSLVPQASLYHWRGWSTAGPFH